MYFRLDMVSGLNLSTITFGTSQGIVLVEDALHV